MITMIYIAQCCSYIHVYMTVSQCNMTCSNSFYVHINGLKERELFENIPHPDCFALGSIARMVFLSRCEFVLVFHRWGQHFDLEAVLQILLQTILY